MTQSKIVVLVAAVAVAIGISLGACSTSSNDGGGGNCGKICATMKAAQCKNDDLTSCEMQCQAQSSSTTCRAQADAVAACWASATFTCDADGISEAKACESQVSAYGACLSGGTGSGSAGTGGSGNSSTATGSTTGSGTGGSGNGGTGGSGRGGGSAVENCVTACTKADALHCPSDVPGSCASQCPSLAAQAPQCSMQFAAVMACAVGSTFACDSQGRAALQGCQNESAAYLVCFFGAADGGAP